MLRVCLGDGTHQLRTARSEPLDQIRSLTRLPVCADLSANPFRKMWAAAIAEDPICADAAPAGTEHTLGKAGAAIPTYTTSAAAASTAGQSMAAAATALDDSREARFLQLVGTPGLDIATLRELSWSGVPEVSDSDTRHLRAAKPCSLCTALA